MILKLITVDTLVNSKLWEEYDSNIVNRLEELIKNILPQTKLYSFLEKDVELELSLVLTYDDEIKELNKIYRLKDKPTNVLSFPLNDFNSDESRSNKQDFLALGDLILSFETIKSEAELQNKNLFNHITHLTIHGILHLIGYDHETREDAEIMETLEIELLKKLAIDNPYIVT